MNSNRARVVDGHVLRDGGGSSASNFSFYRFLLLALLGALLVITNPANDMKDKATNMVDGLVQQVQGKKHDTHHGRQSDLSDWAWQAVLDPPLSVTNYGLFTVEDRHTRVVFSGLTQSWSCSYFDDRMGDFCNALGRLAIGCMHAEELATTRYRPFSSHQLHCMFPAPAKHMCHGGPLLYNVQSYAYTAHRTICFLLISAALLSFCYCGHLPASITSEPLLRAVLTSFGRNHFSLVSLGLDLFNASMFVYPALGKPENEDVCFALPLSRLLWFGSFLAYLTNKQRLKYLKQRKPIHIHCLSENGKGDSDVARRSSGIRSRSTSLL